MDSAAPMEMDRALVVVWAVGLVESVAWTVKVKVPTADGVPLMVPLAARARPVGRAPAVMLQV